MVSSFGGRYSGGLFRLEGASAKLFNLAVLGWGIGFYGPPVFLRTLHETRGWSIAVVSAAITVHFVFSAAFTAYLPEAYKAWGVARVTAVGAGALALGAVLWANAAAPWQLFPIAAVSGAGSAATTGAAINAIVAPWFDKERPRALSLAFNGASVGGLVFTPLWVALIGQLGFRTAAAMIAVAAVAILWPVSAARSAADSGAPPHNAAPAPPLTKRELLRDRRFATGSLGGVRAGALRPGRPLRASADPAHPGLWGWPGGVGDRVGDGMRRSCEAPCSAGLSAAAAGATPPR